MTEQVINSRTFSINGEFDSDLLGDYDVEITTTESGRVFIQCATLEDAANVNSLLVENEYRPRNVSYSLFYKSTDGTFADEDNVREVFESICPHANIIYMRLNNDSASGKLVVDTLADYQTFKAQNELEGGLNFYHFNTRNSRRGPPRTEEPVVEQKVEQKVEKKTKKTSKTTRKSKKSITSDV